jgi:hypothetical protein
MSIKFLIKIVNPKLKPTLAQTVINKNMKKILLLIVLAIACYMFFSRCSQPEQGQTLQVPASKQLYMTGFENLVAQEGRDGMLYNDEEWKMMNKCFCIYVEEYIKTTRINRRFLSKSGRSHQLCNR